MALPATTVSFLLTSSVKDNPYRTSSKVLSTMRGWNLEPSCDHISSTIRRYFSIESIAPPESKVNNRPLWTILDPHLLDSKLFSNRDTRINGPKDRCTFPKVLIVTQTCMKRRVLFVISFTFQERTFRGAHHMYQLEIFGTDGI